MEYDKYFKDAISGCSNIEDVLDRFFGFLERNTDAYHNIIDPSDYDPGFGIALDDINKLGFPKGYFSNLIYKIVGKYAYKYASEHQSYILNNTELAKKYLPKIDLPPTDPLTTSLSPNNKPIAVNSTGLNSHNGGVTEHYTWSQSLTDITIEIDCKTHVKRNDITVKITPFDLYVRTPNFEISGKWYMKINNDNEFNWYIQDNNVVIISIDKHADGWWECLLKGDPKIDTGKIESVKKLSEFDEKTQHFITSAMRQIN